MSREFFFILAAAVSVILPAGGAPAQPVCPDGCASPTVRWHMQADERSPIPGVQAYPLDSLTVVAHELLRSLQREGYYEATIEGVDTTSTADGVRITFQVDRGMQTVIDRLTVTGVSVAESTTVGGLVDTGTGEVARTDRLEEDIDRILRHYEAIGYPLAEVEVRKLSMQGDPRRLSIELHVEEGPPVVLKRITLPGARRVTPKFVGRLLKLREGERLTGYNPTSIRQRLEATGLFAGVGEPRLELDGSREAVLEIPVAEGPPGQFDFLLGYKPPSGGRSGQLIGNGFIDLQNLFGGGRHFHFEMDRMSGQVSEVEAGVDLPFTGGLPIRTRMQFQGYQQDSTYGSRTLHADVGYRLDGGVEVSLAGEWKVVRPGIHGAEQSVAGSSLLSGGLGLRYREVDHRINPRRGWLFDVSLYHGRKQFRDTTALIRQQRLESQLRAFLPTLERQLLVVGYDAWFLQSSIYDIADLYRIGGTRTLRGYEEDQFSVRMAARGLVEYRLQIDRQSYGFVFADLGYLVRPEYGSINRARWWRWAYGAGAQVETNVGLVKLSYALTPRAGVVGGRIHLGMSLAL